MEFVPDKELKVHENGLGPRENLSKLLQGGLLGSLLVTQVLDLRLLDGGFLRILFIFRSRLGGLRSLTTLAFFDFHGLATGLGGGRG